MAHGSRWMRRPNPKFLIAAVGSLAALLAGTLIVSPPVKSQTLPLPGRSTNIALTGDDQRLVVVNRDANSVSVIRVRVLGMDTGIKVAEIPVGREPRCVALSPDDREAYVTNAESGTVSVIDLVSLSVVAEIPVGTEPRGCAVTPNGTLILVALHTEGKLVAISRSSRTVVGSVPLGGNPTAIAVTSDGNASDADETIFVTNFFSEPVPGGPGEGFDTGRQGIVWAFRLSPPFGFTRIPLAPLSDAGFTANRASFCPLLTPGLHPAHAANPFFCPDPTAAAANAAITQNPQGAFPNQLLSALIRGNTLILPSIGAAPSPPVLNINFNSNVQALVHLVNTQTLQQVGDAINLNNFVKLETQPANATASLDRLFGNDIVALDANPAGTDFLIVSRGGNFVFRFTIGQPLRRLQTGNLPSGVVVSRDGTRAYTNNEVNYSVTALNLVNHSVITLDVPSSEPPAPGTFAHAVLVGKLAFFTALGIPDNGFQGTPIRDFVPLQFRGKQSDNAWSSCGSCHPDGLADSVTWIFAAGPRQTLPLDSFFAKDNPADQKLVLWTANRGSNTDFNANSRGVQGGCGFASDDFAPAGQCLAPFAAGGGPATLANPNIYDHGLVQGASDALDVQTLWIFAGVRPLQQPQPADQAALARGRAVFAASCASCHGGPKWTKSQIFHRDNPAFDRNPALAGATPTDPGVAVVGPLFSSFTAVDDPAVSSTVTIKYLEDVGTFNVGDPLEVRQNGVTAFGVAGFVPPSLLSINYHAPYLHNGMAPTLDAVFPLHRLGGGTIATTLTAPQQGDLLVFLQSIDGRTVPFRSEGDDFRDAVGLP
jgi:YVTN family beta-propeller protein